MFKYVFTLLLALVWTLGGVGDKGLNGHADNIVGLYEGTQQGYRFRARVSRQADNTFQAKVVWLEKDCDEQGRKLLDTKNPDRKLRNTPCDQVVLLTGLRHDAKRQQWNGGKVYDPLRGIRANAACWFGSEGVLHVKGSLMGISETVKWKKLK